MLTTDDKTMLALAALTYRGYGHHSDGIIAQKLDPWLPLVAEEGLGTWKRVWGPASFRAPTSIVDDAMVYVVKQQDVPANASPRYVVAVRGTNPISLFDWVFGDFWVRHRIPWTGAPAVSLSASTALGLAIIQNLTWEEPPSALGSLAGFANAITSATQGFVNELTEMLPARVLRQPPPFDDDALLDRIGIALGQAATVFGKSFWGQIRNHLDDVFAPLRKRLEQHVFDTMLRQIAVARGSGVTLLDYLTANVEPNATVAVTGHSKGGALSVATALWLEERLAPAKRATIQCWAFAGPTAGDATFVQRYDAALAARTRSIVNRCDIVPQAWAVRDLAGVGKVYPRLSAPTVALSNAVGKLGYAHVGGTRIAFGTTPSPGPILQQLVDNHMNAYLREARFGSPRWTAESIFLDPF